MPNDKRGTKKRKGDRRRRKMLLPTKRGTKTVVIRGSRKASELGRYLSGIGNFLRSGDTDALDEFVGRSIAGYRLITDPDTLTSLAQAGALQLDDIYATPGASP
jgi:hypothetical protein